MVSGRVKQFLKNKKDKFEESKTILKAQAYGISQHDSLKVNDVWKAIKYIGAETKANQSFTFAIISYLLMKGVETWLFKFLFIFSLVGVFQQIRNVYKVGKLIKE